MFAACTRSLNFPVSNGILRRCLLLSLDTTLLDNQFGVLQHDLMCTTCFVCLCSPHDDGSCGILMVFVIPLLWHW